MTTPFFLFLPIIFPLWCALGTDKLLHLLEERREKFLEWPIGRDSYNDSPHENWISEGVTKCKNGRKNNCDPWNLFGQSFAIHVTKHRLGMAAIHKQLKEKFGVAKSILIHCWAWQWQYYKRCGSQHCPIVLLMSGPEPVLTIFREA